MKYPFSAPNLQPNVLKSMIFASVGVEAGGVRLRRKGFAGDSCLTVGIIADVGQVVGTVVAHCRARAGAAGPAGRSGCSSCAPRRRQPPGMPYRAGLPGSAPSGLPGHDTGAGLGLLLAEGLGHIEGRVIAPPHSGDVIGVPPTNHRSFSSLAVPVYRRPPCRWSWGSGRWPYQRWRTGRSSAGGS